LSKFNSCNFTQLAKRDFQFTDLRPHHRDTMITEAVLTAL